MAIHEREREERNLELALAMKKRAEQEELDRYYRRLRADIDDVTKPASGMLNRSIRGEINKDVIGRQAREEFIAVQAVTAAVGGAALLVAAAAADALYNKRVEDAIKEINSSYETNVRAKHDAIVGMEPEGYDKYAQRLADARADLMANAPGMFKDYNDAVERERRGLEMLDEKRDRRVDDTLHQFEQFKDNYDSEVDKIKKDFVEESKRIHSTMSGSEATIALSHLQEEKDSKLQAARDEYERETHNLVGATQRAHQSEEHLRSQLDGSADRMATHIAERETGRYMAHVEERERPERPDRPRHAITREEFKALSEDEQKLYKAGMKEARREYREEKREYRQEKAEYKDSKDRGTALKNAMTRANNTIGNDLAMVLGTDEEKKLLSLVEKDKRARRETESLGGVHIPVASQADYERAKQIQRSYTGKISSERDIKQTIHNLQTASNELTKKSQSLNGSLRNVNQSIAGLRQMQAEGAGTPEIQKKLNELMKQKSQLHGELHKINELKNGVNNHAESLRKNGKILSDITGRKYVPLPVLGNILRNSNNEPLLQIKKPAFLYKSHDKAVDKASKRALGMMMKSFSVIDRELTKSLNKGNDIHNAMFGAARSAAQLGRKYNLAIATANIAFKTIMFAPGVLAKCSGKVFARMGRGAVKRWEVFLRAHPRWEKLFSFGGRFGKSLGNSFKATGKTLLRAPSAILGAPMKLMQIPQDLAKGAMRFTFKATVKTAGFASKVAFRTTRGALRLTRKAVGKSLRFVGRHTLGRVKFFRNMQARALNLRSRFKMARDIFGKAGGWIKSKFRSAGGWFRKIGLGIAGLISSIVGTLTLIIGYLLLGSVGLVMIILLFAAISAAWAAFVAWLYSQTAEFDSFVKNEPHFIINQAINYRNSELEVVGSVSQATKASDKYRIPVNQSPVYYAVYDATAHKTFGDYALEWLGFTGEERFEGKNQYALGLIQSLTTGDNAKYKGVDLNGFQENGKQPSWWEDFLREVGEVFGFDALEQKLMYYPATYDNVSVKYYDAKYLVKNSDGSYKEHKRGNYLQTSLVANAKESNYELSNAKDALAIVDVLYNNNSDLQKTEVLAYLGTGDYQVGKVYAPVKDQVEGYQSTNNLFWASHRIMYSSGNLESDIWYHVTSTKAVASGTTRTYNVNTEKQYDANGKQVKSKTTACNNTIMLQFPYTATETVVYEHTNIDSVTTPFVKDVYKEYSATELNRSLITDDDLRNVSGLTANQLFYGKYSANVDFEFNSKSYTITTYYEQDKTNTGTTHKPQLKAPVLQGGLTTIIKHTLKPIATNSVQIGTIHNDHNVAEGIDNSKLLFFKKADNIYYVLNRSGHYLGQVNLDTDYSAIKTAVTQCTINETTTTINLDDNGKINLPAFFLTWNDEAGSYEFQVMCYFDKNGTQYEQQPVEKEVTEGFKYEQARFLPNNVKVACNHTRVETTSGNLQFYVCKGHIDLDVKIAVATNENDEIYNAAMKVEGLQDGYEASHFLWIFTSDNKHDANGWGTVHYNAFSPAKDWANIENRSLARTKAASNIEYEIAPDKTIASIGMTIKHWNRGGPRGEFASLAPSPDGNALYGIMSGTQTYYVQDFVNGPQYRLSYYTIGKDNKLVLNSDKLSMVLANGSAITNSNS